MNLIRNGGFEDGSLVHWVMRSAGSLVLDAANSHRGSGCAKLTSSGAGIEYFDSSDYIEVKPYEVLITSAWVKSAAARGCKIYAVEYDENLEVIDHIELTEITSTAMYSMLHAEHVVSAEASYVILRLAVSGSANSEIFYFDDAKVYMHDPEVAVYYTTELCVLNSINVSGDSSGDRYDQKGFITYIADLHVTTANGTNPTLDLTVVELDGHGDEVIVGTFAQKVAVGSERILLSNVTGNQMYVRYIIGGVNPVFYFEVSVNGKR